MKSKSLRMFGYQTEIFTYLKTCSLYHRFVQPYDILLSLPGVDDISSIEGIDHLVLFKNNI